MSPASISDTLSPSPLRPSNSGLLAPCVIVFASGFCIMLTELVASRLVAGYIGQSLATWTAVIGVILAGISIGNYVGGRLADRYSSHRLVPFLLVVSSAMTFSILFVVDLIGQMTFAWAGELWWARIVTVVVVSFLLPGTVLGTISPAIVKWALDRGFATGQTVGTIYAWNTIGSIAGTFVTGFYLISLFYVQTVVIISGVGLAVAAVLVVLTARNLQSLAPIASTASDRAVQAAGERGTGLLIPGLVVFFSGFCVMVVELVASRLVAGHIGQSLFTWTSVIGVVLAGISLGNYVGGRLADLFESRSLVGTLFFLSSVTCMSVLQVHHIIDNAQRTWMGVQTPWGVRVLCMVFAAFFLPCTALGTISPAVAKWALDKGYATGRTVGTVYAWNTAGSICGTFATGFVLISTFYVSNLIALTSLSLALLAVVFAACAGPWLNRLAFVGWLGVACFASVFAMMPADKFEDRILAIWPVTLDDIPLRSSDDTSLRSAVDDLRPALKRIDPDGLAKLQTLVDELDAKLQWRSFDPELDVPARNELIEQQAVGINSALRELAVAVANSGETDTSGQSNYQRVHLQLDALQVRFGKLAEAIEQCEINRLRTASKLVARNDEINYYDQYSYHEHLENENFTYYDESNYYTISVSESTDESNLEGDYEIGEDGTPRTDDAGEPLIRTRRFRQLVLDALIHGYVDLSDYSYLHYEYEHIYATVSHRVLKKHEREGQDLSVLFLGGGSYTFPRYLTTIYGEDKIHCDVAEIDYRVTEAVRRSMGLNAAAGKRFYVLADPLAKDRAPERHDHQQFPGVFDKARFLLGGLFPGKSLDVSRRFSDRLQAAGALQVQTTERPFDYVLDVRKDRHATDPIQRLAAERDIPVIGEEELGELLAKTSHDNVATVHGDARQFVMLSPNQGKYDVIYGDAFNDFSVPAHLTTVEFNRQMATLLKPDGIFMANVIDIWPVSKFMGAYRNTLAKVFKHVYLLFSDHDDPGDSRSTFIIVCSQVPMELTDLGERPEDLKGLVSVVMDGWLLAPVIRGGLTPLAVETHIPDGAQKSIKLRRKCHAAGVRVPRGSRVLLDLMAKSSSPSGDTFNFVTQQPGDGGANGKSEHLLTVDLAKATDSKDSVRIIYTTKNGRRVVSRWKEGGQSSYEEMILDPDDIEQVKIEVIVGKPIFMKDNEYTLSDGQVLDFKEPLRAGYPLEVALYGNEEIILTDDYCPVDNMLAEVIETRIAD